MKKFINICCKPQKLLSIITQKLSFTVYFRQSLFCAISYYGLSRKPSKPPNLNEDSQENGLSITKIWPRRASSSTAFSHPNDLNLSFGGRRADDLKEDPRNLTRQPITASEDAGGAITIFYYHPKYYKKQRKIQFQAFYPHISTD